MIEQKTYKWGSNRLWYRIAMVAGVFAVLVGILMIANYIQYKKADPVNMTVINALVERLNENPADSLLRNEIRTLDLLSRKAYFTSQWQICTGGYLVLASIALMIISLQIVEYRKKVNPVLSPVTADETMSQNKKARKWIILAGSSVLITAMVFAFFPGHQGIQSENKNQANESSLEQDLASGKVTIVNLDVESADTLVAETVQSDSAEAAPGKSAAPVSNDNFPFFRGNAGIASKQNIPSSWDGPGGRNVLWKTKIPLPGHNSPVIWGGKIFATGGNTEKQEVYCFDAADGKLLWTGRVGKGTKKPKVSAETGYAASSSAADGSGVYAIFATGDLAAFDPTGKKMWENDLGLPENSYGHSSSLVCYNGNVIVQLDQRSSQKIMAFSSKTGAMVWNTTRPVKTSWSSPILVNTGKQTELLTVAEPYVAAYNPVNGQELWKIECIGGEVGPSLAYANGIAFSVNEYAKLCAVKTGEQPSILWETDEYLSDIPSPAANDKYLFLATSYGTVVCYDAQTGEKYWEKDLGQSIHSSPMIAENKVYIMDITGVMHIFKADKVLSLIGEPKLGEHVSATPAFQNGKIFIRGEEHLYCIGK